MAEQTIDTAVEMFFALVTAVLRRSKNELDDLTQRVAKDKNQLVILLRDIGSVIVDDQIADADLRDWIYTKVIEKPQLEERISECELLARPADYNSLDFVESRYNYTRQFSPDFLDTISLRPNEEEDELFQAVELIKQCNEQGSRKIPSDAPTSFAPKSWKQQMQNEDGTLDRHFYELCVLVKLRDALRSGDIAVVGSRRHQPINNYLFDDDHWAENKQKYYEQLSLPQDPAQFLAPLKEKILSLSQEVDRHIPNSPFAEIVDGRLSISREKGEWLSNREEVKQLKRDVVALLPRIKLTDLLIEVDQWTHFTRHFTSLADHEPRTPTLQKSLFASFMASGCNIGLVNMADSTPDLTYRQLFHVSTWYITDETLHKAMTEIINFHHRLPLTSVWGDGTKSSSDGMRFNVPVNAFGAEFHPKYFGKYGRGVTRYSFLSDQFAEFDTIIIPATLREAPYVLDGLLRGCFKSLTKGIC